MSLCTNTTQPTCEYFEPARQLGKIALLALSVAMVPMGGALAQDAPMIHMGSGDTGSQPANMAALRTLARDNGEVKIIIGLETSFEVEGGLSEQAVERQRGSIAARQQDVVSALAAPRNVKRFETIPYMALNVSAADLDRLLAMPGVSSVALDIADAPDLSDSVRLVDAPMMWRLDADGADYSIAIMDTGVRPNHVAFKDKIVASACFSTNSASTTSLCPNGREQQISRDGARAGRDCDTVLPGCGHGTHVAAIAAGDMRRDSGMARGANLVPIQVFSDFGDEALSYHSDQILGLERVLRWRKRFNIVAANMSLGGGAYSGPCDSANPARTAIIENLRSAGVVTVISSGNNFYNGQIGAPACISAAISVGNTTKQDALAASSNHAPMVKMLAPGTGILAANVDGGRRALTTKSGTSMAAPHVAGAFAMLKSYKPDATIDEIERALVCSGVPVTRAGLPKPRIDMRAARNYLDNPDTSKSWSFRNDAQVNAWTAGSGSWFRDGNTMRVQRVLGTRFFNATAPFCGDNMRANVRMSYTDSTYNYTAGILMSTDMNAQGDFAGLLFGYGYAGPGSEESRTTIRGGIYQITNATAASNVIAATPLCTNNSVLTNIQPTDVLALRARKNANSLSFSINGTDVCSATTDSRFANGRVGVFMETDPTGGVFDVTVNRVELRALGGPRGYEAPTATTSISDSESGPRAARNDRNVLASSTILP